MAIIKKRMVARKFFLVRSRIGKSITMAIIDKIALSSSPSRRIVFWFAMDKNIVHLRYRISFLPYKSFSL